MTKPYSKGVLRIAEIGGAIGGLAILAMALLVFYEILMRFFFNMPSHWSVDFTVYLLIGLSFVALASAQAEGRNIVIDLITSRFNPTTKAMWGIAVTGISVVFAFL